MVTSVKSGIKKTAYSGDVSAGSVYAAKQTSAAPAQSVSEVLKKEPVQSGYVVQTAVGGVSYASPQQQAIEAAKVLYAGGTPSIYGSTTVGEKIKQNAASSSGSSSSGSSNVSILDAIKNLIGIGTSGLVGAPNITLNLPSTPSQGATEYKTDTSIADTLKQIQTQLSEPSKFDLAIAEQVELLSTYAAPPDYVQRVASQAATSESNWSIGGINIPKTPVYLILGVIALGAIAPMFKKT